MTKVICPEPGSQMTIGSTSAPEPWETCDHKWGSPWFGPVIRCGKCRAFTIMSMDPKESKPIFGPNSESSAGTERR